MALRLEILCLVGLAGQLLAKDAAVVFVVDPTWDCVSSYAAKVPLLHQYKIVKVMTRHGTPPPCISDEHGEIYRNITYNSWVPNDALAAEEICPKLRSMGMPIAAVIPTFDPAVGLSDRLAACVGTRGNPSEGPLATARRDKWAEGEAVRKAGIRSVKEKVVSSWSEAKEYLESLNPPLSSTNPVIFKILKGSSSDGVTKVYSLAEAESVLSSTLGSKTKFGDKNGEVLIQEFLKGKEYVIDSASRDGVHKTVVVWHEDIRPGNGIFNFYYGFKAMNPQDEKIKKIIDYANKVLDATGLQNGASDMEVFWLEDEGTPCLVDLNARWTAMMWHDGLRLEKAIFGIDQITATINAYLDADAFDKMPSVPHMKEHAAIVWAYAYQPGILRGVPGIAVAEKLPSYLGRDYGLIVVGKPLDNWTPISILLANSDKAVVDADYDHIIGLDKSNAFFDTSPSTGYVSLTALRSGDGAVQTHRMLAMAATVMLATSAVLGFAAMSRGNVQDGTEYLTIE